MKVTVVARQIVWSIVKRHDLDSCHRENSLSERDSLQNLINSFRNFCSARGGARGGGRKYERCDFPVELKITSHAPGECHCDAFCLDISEAGVAFVTEANLNLQDLLELSFEINGKVEFRQYARLIYRCGPRYGAYFIQPG